MFENTKAFGGFSADDVSEASEFYGETPGLRVCEEGEPLGMLQLHVAGATDVLVYPEADHTPVTFTVLNFPVEGIEEVHDELTGRGVRFERYGGAGQDEKGIHRGEGASFPDAPIPEAG